MVRVPYSTLPIYLRFNVSIDADEATGVALGRIKIALHTLAAPQSATVFQTLCTGSTRDRQTNKPIGYKGTKIARMIPGFVMTGGELSPSVIAGSTMLSAAQRGITAEIGSGTGFDGEGVVGMGSLDGSNAAGGAGGGSFFITFAEARFLDGKCVVVGKITEGWDVLRKIEKVRTREGDRPVNEVLVSECGEM